MAEVAGEIVGYILFTRAVIRQEVREHETLVLAPVVVAPDFQRKGIGGGSLKKQPLGFKSVLLVGDPTYHPFGYRSAEMFGIVTDLELPAGRFVAYELMEGARMR